MGFVSRRELSVGNHSRFRLTPGYTISGFSRAQAGTYPSIPVGQEPVAEDDPKAPLTRLKDVGFKSGEWHHLVLTWDRFNTGKKDGTHTL